MAMNDFFSGYSFSLILAVGIGIGLLWSLGSLPTSQRRHAQQTLDAATLALLTALIGGRIAYVMINWHYFQQNPLEIVAFWLGGISWIGALAGGLAGLFITAQLQKLSFAALSDRLLPLFCSIAVSAWFGSWVTGAVYGHPSDSWWSIRAADEWGIVAHRLPVPLIGIFSALVIHILIRNYLNRLKHSVPGLATCLELSGFFITFLSLLPMRDDPMIKFADIPLDAWASLVSLIVSSILAVYFIHITNSLKETIDRQGSYEN